MLAGISAEVLKAGAAKIVAIGTNARRGNDAPDAAHRHAEPRR
jgi:hypothetical protein